MFILFSPSEEKLKSENSCKIETLMNFFVNFDTTKLFIKSDFRKEFIKQYILNFNNLEYLETIFGIKDVENILKLFSTNLHKAIDLYQGVSFKELSYKTMNNAEKDYINKHLIIFSNLFGPILASDEIPFYKLKQGIKINNINQAKHYKNDTSKQLDLIFNDFIIDLRAKIYEEYYEVKVPSFNFVFSKNNKQLSHSSKIYRAKVLKTLASNNITSKEKIYDIINTNFDIINIEKSNNKTIFYINIKD